MNIERRIEKAVGLDAGPMLVPVLIIDVDSAEDRQSRFPEPVADWVTAQRAVNEAARRWLPCIFVADPVAEQKARYGAGLEHVEQHGDGPCTN